MNRRIGRTSKFVLYALALTFIVSGAFVAALPVILGSDFAREKITHLLSESLATPVTLGDNIHLALGLEPRLSISALAIRNPRGFPESEMFRASQASLSVPLRSIILGAPEVSNFEVTGVKLHFLENAKGELNWGLLGKESPQTSIKQSEPEGPFPIPVIHSLSLRDIQLSFHYPKRNREVTLQSFTAKNINLDTPGSLDSTLSVDGLPLILKGGLSSINSFLAGEDLDATIGIGQELNSIDAELKVSLRGKSQCELTLRGQDFASLSSIVELPLPDYGAYTLKSKFSFLPSQKKDIIAIDQLDMSVAKTELEVSGKIELTPEGAIAAQLKLSAPEHSLEIDGNYLESTAIHAKLKASGGGLETFASLVPPNWQLPQWTRYSLSGQIYSNSRKEGDLSFTELDLRIDENDLEGEVELSLKPFRVSADLRSSMLDIPKLAALQRQTQTQENSPKHNTPAKIPFETLKGLEASVQLKASRLLPTEGVELANANIDARIADGKLFIPALEGQVFGGTLTTNIEASAEETRWKLKATEVEASQIIRLVSSESVVEGKFNVGFDLKSKGDALPDLLKALRGNIALNSDNAELKNKTLHTTASGLSEILSPILEGSKKAESECVVLDFYVENGIARSKEQVVKLNDIFLFAEGKIDLVEANLTYNFNVQSTNPALASLIPPFRAFGKLNNIRFSPSLSGSVASVADTGEAAVDAVLGVANSAFKIVAGRGTKAPTGVALCKAAYASEQKRISSRFGRLIDNDSSRAGLHPSWDQNGDGINDCEDDGSCDHFTDYSQPKSFRN